MDPHHLAKMKISSKGDEILGCIAEAKKSKDFEKLAKMTKRLANL